ncbi:hypothetical protein GCM10011362_27150 [Marinobacter halophilus]|nr:hypothetical protein GCM10011362_27150 [Marinobacter halophilus]
MVLLKYVRRLTTLSIDIVVEIEVSDPTINSGRLDISMLAFKKLIEQMPDNLADTVTAMALKPVFGTARAVELFAQLV